MTSVNGNGSFGGSEWLYCSAGLIRCERDRHVFPKHENKRDVIKMDDIQLFSGDEKMLRELEFAIDSLIRAEMQVVISADMPPKKLAGFSPRMKKIMGMGLVAEIEGAMTSIAAYYQIYKSVINLETAKDILKNVF